MSAAALRLAIIGDERVLRLEQEQRAIVEAHLRGSAVDRGAFYVAAVKQFRDHGWGKPVAAPAFRFPVSCDWTPSSSTDPADVPTIPEFLQREVK